MDTTELPTLEYARCPDHAFMAIRFDGIRLTDEKCCGKWVIIARWECTPGDIARIRERARQSIRRERTFARTGKRPRKSTDPRKRLG